MTDCTPTPATSHGYIIRRTGERRSESIVSGGFFAWLYNHPDGRKWRPRFMESVLLHRVIERFADSPLSRHLIPVFMKKAKIDFAEIARPLDRFRSLNAFFTRALKPGARPVEMRPETLVSPGDGKLLVLETIAPDAILPVKGINVRLDNLLGDPRLAATYRGGAAMVLRLYVQDYHRLHFPCSGVPAMPVPIKGWYYSVSPFEGNTVDFYVTNTRALTLFDSDGFGRLAFVDIGGFLIASIRHSFTPGVRVEKGAEKSMFRFGGSTLVLLFPPGRVLFDRDILENSRTGVETYVQYGEAIGVRAA